VENVVHGFLKLEEKLAPGSPAAGQVPLRLPSSRLHFAFTHSFGRATQAYFISDDAPVEYFKFASQFGRKFGHTFRIIPHYVATVLAHIVEFLARLTEYVNILRHDRCHGHHILVCIRLTLSSLSLSSLWVF
jgi:hypothetical protein